MNFRMREVDIGRSFMDYMERGGRHFNLMVGVVYSMLTGRSANLLKLAVDRKDNK